MSDKSILKSTWFGVAFVALILIIGTIFFGFSGLNRLQSEREAAGLKTISDLFIQESYFHPVIPDILVVNLSPKNKKHFSDSINKEVSKYLIRKYTLLKSDTSKISIYPYVSFIKKNSNKPITGEQVEELKKYIEFLINTCNKAIEDSRNNIDTEISKINIWVTIWIGVFGLLGIFIPIIINFKNISDYNIIKNEINQLNAETITTKNNIQTFSALNALNTISNLETMLFVYGENSIKIFMPKFTSIRNHFININDYKNSLYKEFLEELKKNLILLASSTLIKDRNITDAFSTFAKFIEDKLYNNEKSQIKDHNEILIEFDHMLQILNSYNCSND